MTSCATLVSEVGDSATAQGIAQQPAVWRDLAWSLADGTAKTDSKPLDDFLRPLLNRPDLRIVLTGAGSSAFAGAALAPALAVAIERRVDAMATTTIVSDPGAVYTVVAQLYALLSSVRVGRQPDNPLPSGKLNRVVRG